MNNNISAILALQADTPELKAMREEGHKQWARINCSLELMIDTFVLGIKKYYEHTN